jgi:hypothetical protein
VEINQHKPGTVTVVSNKAPSPTVYMQYPPVIGNEIQETMMNFPVWNKYVEHFSDGIVCFTLFIAGGCEPNFYVKDKRRLMIIVTMPKSAYSAMLVLQQQGIESGDQANNRFFTQLQASMDKRRKKASEEMKILPSNYFRHEYLVHNGATLSTPTGVPDWRFSNMVAVVTADGAPVSTLGGIGVSPVWGLSAQGRIVEFIKHLPKDYYFLMLF